MEEYVIAKMGYFLQFLVCAIGCAGVGGVVACALWFLPSVWGSIIFDVDLFYTFPYTFLIGAAGTFLWLSSREMQGERLFK